MTKMPFDDKNKNNNQYGIQFDPQEYLHHLEGMELTDDQAEAILATLWGILVQFVDLGFEVDVGLNDSASQSKISNQQAALDNAGRVGGRRPAFKKGKGDGP